MVFRRPSSQLVASFQPSAASFLSQMKYLPRRAPRGQAAALGMPHPGVRLACMV